MTEDEKLKRAHQIEALHNLWDKVKDINTVLYTDLNRGRLVRVCTLIEDEIVELERDL